MVGSGYAELVDRVLDTIRTTEGELLADLHRRHAAAEEHRAQAEAALEQSKTVEWQVLRLAQCS